MAHATMAVGGALHVGNITPQKLGPTEWGDAPLREKLIKLFFIMGEQAMRKRWMPTASPCRAIAITDIGILVGVSHGGSSQKLHAEEHIAEQYYEQTGKLTVPIELMFIDLEPCDNTIEGKAMYSGHRCTLMFTTKGKAISSGKLFKMGKVKFELYTNTNPGGVFYLQDIVKGANNLASMWSEGPNGILARWHGAARIQLSNPFSQPFQPFFHSDTL